MLDHHCPTARHRLRFLNRASAFLAVSAVFSSLWAAPAQADDAVNATVAGGGVTLKSAVITLPSSDRDFPNGPHVDAVESNCLACHSAGMVLNQPALSRTEWQSEVMKMIQIFKAPVSETDAKDVVDYLAALKVEK